MIAEGTFLARAAGPLQWVKSPEKGTQGIHVMFILKDGPDAGQRVDWTPWITDNTSQRISESLEYMGYDGENDASAAQKDVLVVVKHETNPKDGKTYARVAFVNDPNRARFESLSGAELTAAKSRLKAARAASKASNASTGSADDEPRF